MSEKTTCVEKSDTAPVVGHLLIDRKKQRSRGQTLTEYAVLMLLVMLVLIGVVGVFMAGIGSYYLNLVKIITLPFP